MSEYIIQGETLTKIADAIRAKTGGTAPINFSNIETEIENIPVGGGGGLPEGLVAVATGTFTLTSDSSTSKYVEHGLGQIPDFCWWVIETDVSTTRLSTAAVTGYLANKPASYSSSLTSPYYTQVSAVSYNSSGSLQRTAQSLEAASHTDTTCCIWANTQYKLKAGHTYRWVCGIVKKGV